VFVGSFGYIIDNLRTNAFFKPQFSMKCDLENAEFWLFVFQVVERLKQNHSSLNARTARAILSAESTIAVIDLLDHEDPNTCRPNLQASVIVQPGSCRNCESVSFH
jgi:predicted Zn-ribbon and HTH transcriptional regulator